MATMDNLKDAFAGESQANRKYTAFAKKAEADGFPQVARLFRAAAAAETVHALEHFRVMGGIQSTKDNLQAAIEGEGFEFQQMYPKFVSTAKEENNQDAFYSFDNAMKVEEIHHDLYSEALKSVSNGKDLPSDDIYVCRCCGNTVIGAAPSRCPVCGKPEDYFDEIA